MATPPLRRILLQQLLLPPNVTAGCNPLVVMSLAYMLRATNNDPEAILVATAGQGLFRISDGRHRFLGAVIAGRRDILCQVEER